MHKYPILFVLLFAAICCRAQNDEYRKHIARADSLYTARQYRVAGQAYHAAFASLGSAGVIDDRYDAACAWSMAEERDSAFFNLLRIAGTGIYANLNRLLIDPALDNLHPDGRWKELTGMVAANKRRNERAKGLDTLLTARLDTIYRDDQRLRLFADKTGITYGYNSREYRAIWTEVGRMDSLNSLKVKVILDRYGWLGPDRVGNNGNQTLFLVIQHSNLAMQEHYLPMMREAARKGSASAASLALLEDRVLLRQGRKQKYGTQVLCLAPGKCEVDNLDDPLRVDERRAAVGLPPLAEYVKQWNISWDAPAYLKKQQEGGGSGNIIR